MIEYSIHTIELTSPIDSATYQRIQHILSQKKASVEKRPFENIYKGIKKTSYTYRNLKMSGINSITLLTIELMDDIPLKMLLYIEVNPYDAIQDHPNTKAKIIKASLIRDAMLNIFHTLASHLGKDIMNDLSLTLKRVDFCLNIKMKTEAIAETYISLLKKGIPTKSLSEVKVFNPSQHRMTAYNDSFLLKCNSYSFQIYSKYLQMCKKNLPGQEDAVGVVRFELRAEKSKLKQLAKKYCLPSPTGDMLGFLENTPQITKEEIPYLLSKIVGTGTLCKFSELKSELEYTTFKKKDKKLMLDISYYLSKHSSGEKLLDDLCLDYKDWRRILKKFNELGCSPIPVPSRSTVNHYPGIDDWNYAMTLK